MQQGHSRAGVHIFALLNLLKLINYMKYIVYFVWCDFWAVAVHEKFRVSSLIQSAPQVIEPGGLSPQR